MQAVAVSETLIAASASCNLVMRLFSVPAGRLKLRTSAIGGSLIWLGFELGTWKREGVDVEIPAPGMA